MKPLACCIGLVLAQIPATALADSANGVDTTLGSGLNTAPINPSTAADALDPAGMGLNPNVARTPTGQMYNRPLSPVEETKTTAGGWEYFGMVEAGALSGNGDKNSREFKRHKDADSGIYLGSFGLSMEKKDEARFFEATAGAAGRDDQFYGLSFGRYNDWKVKAFFNETASVFTTTYRNLWSGTGTANLTLNPPLVAGPVAPATAATTDIAIGNAALATPESELGLVRKKGGIWLDKSLAGGWKLFASATNEKREGARPFALVSAGGGGTGGVEISESIDYDTSDFLAGIQYSDKLNSFNVQASASLFRNNAGTMTVENPMFLAAANGIASFPQATFDLYPDNDFYNLKGEYARSLPDFYKGRFTGVVSLSSSRQNGSLIPSTTDPLATVNGVAGGAWNTLNSLSKQNAGAQIDSRLVDLGLALKPADKLEVKGKLRYYETDNSTEYLACNPLNGQWGRLTNDGSAAQMVNALQASGAAMTAGQATALSTFMATNGCNAAALANYLAASGLVPAAGNINIRNIPYDRKQLNTGLSGNYRLSSTSSLNAAFEQEEIKRDHRERDKTREDKIKVGYVNSGLENSTLRLSLENDRRRGSTYISDPYDEFHSAALGAPATTGAMTSWIHVNNLHRKFDLADRDQSIFNARFNYLAHENLDLGVSLQLKGSHFPHSEYGGKGCQNQNSVNLDLNYQPSTDMSLYGYYSYQDGEMEQQGISQSTCTIGQTTYLYSDGSVNVTGLLTPAQIAAGITVVGNSGAITAANFASLCGAVSPTSPLYPTSRTWNVSTKDHNDTLGLGMMYKFSKAKLDVNYTFAVGTTKIGYSFNPAALALTTSGAPTAAQLVTLGLIGNGFSDLVTEQNVLNINVLVPIDKVRSLRFLFREEVTNIRDWHYDGVSANPTPGVNQQTYLDGGPRYSRTSLFGVLFQFKM